LAGQVEVVSFFWKLEDIGRGVFWAALAALTCSMLVMTPDLWRGATALGSSADGVLFEARTAIREARTEMQDSYWDIKAMLNTMAVLARDSEEFVHDFRAALIGGPDSRGLAHTGLVEEVRVLVADIHGPAVELLKSLDKVAGAATQVLVPLRQTLENIAALTARLDHELAAGSPKALATMDELNSAIHHLDVLLADPHIQRALAHVDGSAESIDVALRPWRTKAKLIKVVFNQIFDVLKHAVPFLLK
jgi:hypothetical protein